jgi:hypothetical protein
MDVSAIKLATALSNFHPPPKVRPRGWTYGKWHEEKMKRRDRGGAARYLFIYSFFLFFYSPPPPVPSFQGIKTEHAVLY